MHCFCCCFQDSVNPKVTPSWDPAGGGVIGPAQPGPLRWDPGPTERDPGPGRDSTWDPLNALGPTESGPTEPKLKPPARVVTAGKCNYDHSSVLRRRVGGERYV